MQRFVYFIIAVFISTSAFSQEYADEMNKLKGKPIRVELRFKKGLLHYNSDWYYLYKFFDSGKIKVQKNYERGKLRAEYHYKYDSKGNKISEVCIGAVNHKTDSTEIFKNEYTFDILGNIKTEILKGPEHELIWSRDSIIYNNSNQPIKYVKVYPPWSEKGQRILEYYTLTYNEKGLVEEINMNDIEGSHRKNHYWYYDNGNISKSEVNHLAVFKSNNRLALNNNRLTEKKVVEYFYKYDRNGNWIERYTKVNNSQKQLEIKRLIKYN